jgi:Na+-driven multidrug efflux pump
VAARNLTLLSWSNQSRWAKGRSSEQDLRPSTFLAAISGKIAMGHQSIHQEHPPLRWAIPRELIGLTWPIALSMLSYSLMTAVDTLFVGRIGADAIAAVGLGGLISFTFLTFGMGLLRSGKVIVAHAVGARRHSEVPRLAAATVVVSLLSTVGT